jgi:hypothetical protein
MLKPLDEILIFLYLNEIGTKNEHFNLATLMTNNQKKFMKLIVKKNLMFLSCKNFNLPKKAYNFKKEILKYTFEHRN